MSSPATRGPSSPERASTVPGPSGSRVRFQLPRSAYVAVLFLGLGITPFVRSPVLVVLYVVPVLAAVFVARRATVVDEERVRVRAPFGSREVPWDAVRGVLIRPRGSVALVERSGGSLRLPYVRGRHLPLLAELSGGRLPDPGTKGPGTDRPGTDRPGADGPGADGPARG